MIREQVTTSDSVECKKRSTKEEVEHYYQGQIRLSTVMNSKYISGWCIDTYLTALAIESQ